MLHLSAKTEPVLYSISQGHSEMEYSVKGALYSRGLFPWCLASLRCFAIKFWPMKNSPRENKSSAAKQVTISN